MENKTPKILILAGDVRSNMGDRAIRSALVHLIRLNSPEARIFVLSRQPERDRKEFKAEIIGPGILSLFTRARFLRSIDLVIWGGGQLLQDDTSQAKNLYWAFILRWVHRVLRLPVIGLGVGIGPIRSRLGKACARAALSNLSLFAGRDPGTCSWARTLVPEGLRIEQACDLALFLEPPPRDAAVKYLRDIEHIPLKDDECILGVSVRRWFHIKPGQIIPYELKTRLNINGKEDDARFEKFLENLGKALRSFGHARKTRLLFFPMAGEDWERDSVYSRRIADITELPAHVLRLDCDASTTKAIAGMCDLVVSVRMHSAILAMSMGVPTVGILHVRKTGFFYEAMGQQDRTIDIVEAAGHEGDRIIAERLEDTFSGRTGISEELRGRLESVLAEGAVYSRILKDVLS